MIEMHRRPLTAAEIEALTPEQQRDYYLYTVYVTGFMDALETIAAGKHDAEAERIIAEMGADPKSMLAAMARAYCAGVDKGLSLLDGADDNEEDKQ